MNFRFFSLALIIVVVLSACAPAELPPTSTSSPTAILIPTATIDWFPATASPTAMPTQTASPTPNMHPDLGVLILADNFSSPSPWPDTATNNTRVGVENNRLNLYSNISGALLLAPRNAPVIGDFFMEVTASTSLCDGNDEYGLMLRITSTGDHYRFALSCDGRAKIERVLNGAVSMPLEWQAFPVVPAMAPSIVRLSIWASNSEMRFFVNDVLLFTANDTVLYSGRVGAFIRTRSNGPVSVSFSDLMIYALEND